MIADIVAQDDASDSLTLEEALDGSVPDGVSFRIRTHWTLADVMGDGDDVVITKGSLSNADRVLILTPGGTVEQYYFHASITSSDLGWLNANDPTDGSAPDRGTTLLRFFNGFVVIRSSATPVSRKLVGTVNLNPTVVPINTGVNLVSNVYPVNSITLGNSGLENFGSSTFSVVLAQYPLLRRRNLSTYFERYYRNV